MSYSSGFGQPRPIIEYYIRRSGDHFEVAKFANGSEPLDVYEVEYASRPRCSCMAWRSGKTRPCKHVAMVAKFLAAGEPQPFLITR